MKAHRRGRASRFACGHGTIRPPPIVCSSTPSRRAARRGRAATALPSTGRSCRALRRQRPWFLSGGLDAGQCRGGDCGDAARRASTCPPGSRARPAARTRHGSAPSSQPSALPRPRRAAGGLTHERVRVNVQQKPNYLSRRPGRARPFRPLWRPLRRRDADAAHPRPRAGLRGGEGRSGLPGRAHASQHALHRPAEPALFRRAADRASARGLRRVRAQRRRQDLLQARRAQSHRLAQDQQLPRPDPARPPHGQDAHHRGDRRRPARRRLPPPSARASGSPASSTWARPTSSGKSPTSSA